MSNWVFLRGLTRDSRHWGAFTDSFRQRVVDSPVTCVDLPGSGGFHQVESPTSISKMVRHCRQVLAARGIAPPYRLLALSLGAMVAVEWARSAPQELRGCVLLSTSLRPFSPFHRRLRWQNYPAIARMLLQRPNMHKRERAILDLVSNRNERKKDLLNEWIAYQEAAPISSRNALRQLFAAAAYISPQAAPPVPMLLLASKRDRLVHYSCTCRIACKWGLEYRLHEEAGHDLPMDDGLWVIDQINAWLSRSDGQAASRVAGGAG